MPFDGAPEANRSNSNSPGHQTAPRVTNKIIITKALPFPSPFVFRFTRGCHGRWSIWRHGAADYLAAVPSWAFSRPEMRPTSRFSPEGRGRLTMDLNGYVPSPNPDGEPFWKKLKKMAKDCERPEKFLEVADLYEMLREAKASIMTAPSPEKAMGFLDILVMLVKKQGADIAGKFYGVQHLLGSAALVAEKLHRDMPETVEKEDGKRMQHLARSLVRAVQSMSNSPEIPNTKASPQESIVAQPPAPTSASSAEMNLAYQTAPTSSAVGRVIKSAAQTETLDAALEQLDLQGSGANSSQTNLMATPTPVSPSSYFTPPRHEVPSRWQNDRPF